MPKKVDRSKGPEATKNTGSVKLSQTTLYRRGVQSSELKKASDIKKPKVIMKKDNEPPLKEEIPKVLAVSIFVALILSLSALGYYGLQLLIED